MKNFLFSLFIIGSTISSFAQEIATLDVRIAPSFYKYIEKDQNDDPEVNPAEPVKLFQQRSSIFTLENSKYYDDEYEYYFLSFYIPEGKILASFDSEDNILRSVEKLKNTEIPPIIANAIVQRYPGWVVSDNIYLVNHHDNEEIIKKEYKILLEKGHLRRRVYTNENGDFINLKKD